MAIQPFGVKVREKKEEKKRKLTSNQIITILLSLALLVVTIVTGYTTYYFANENTRLQDENFDLQHYNMQAYEFPVEAQVEGGYVNHTAAITQGYGFLNTTFIISTPDITRLIIENCDFQASPYSIYLDHSKVNDWWESFGTDSFMRPQLADYYDNFTYYTNQAGINTISVSIPIEIDFYMNPSYNFQGTSDIFNINPFPVGNMTVTANLTDMQTNNTTEISFNTPVWAAVTIS